MDLEHERRRLLKRDAEWAQLGAKGDDAERILSFWSDDALVYPPGMPVVSGKAAIRSYVSGALAIPGFHITWATSEAILSADGRLAYLLSNNTIRQPGANGQLITANSRAVTIWRREVDEDWRCVIDIWNEEQPLSPSSR